MVGLLVSWIELLDHAASASQPATSTSEFQLVAVRPAWAAQQRRPPCHARGWGDVLSARMRSSCSPHAPALQQALSCKSLQRA